MNARKICIEHKQVSITNYYVLGCLRMSLWQILRFTALRLFVGSAQTKCHLLSFLNWTSRILLEERNVDSTTSQLHFLGRRGCGQCRGSCYRWRRCGGSRLNKNTVLHPSDCEGRRIDVKVSGSRGKRENMFRWASGGRNN